MIFKFKTFFIGFGRLNRTLDGPYGTRAYSGISNRVQYKRGKRIIETEYELHHLLCPCFKCEYRKLAANVNKKNGPIYSSLEEALSDRS